MFRRLRETLNTQVGTLTTSDGSQAMLQAAARFHRHTPTNVLLNVAQRPTATYVQESTPGTRSAGTCDAANRGSRSSRPA